MDPLQAKDTIVLKGIKTPDAEEMQHPLEWGKAYAKTEGITKDQVRKAIDERCEDTP